MKIVWIIPLLLIQSYRIIGSIQDEYNQYSFYQKRPLSPRPLDAMADLTNDLGVCVLRVIAAGGAIGNVAFSPFGLMAVSVLLYEGSSGYSALQIKQTLNLPWEVLAVRIGVRDLNRYLKTYFKSDGFLNGLTMSKEEVCLRPQFKRVLRLYGFDDTNSFLIDSCPETAATTMYPLIPMSVTTHGTVVTEITPTSQIIQVSTNFTNGSASEISTVSTELPAKVTYMGDASFTISNVDTNTNLPMNSQTNMMMVNIETQPHIIPIESSTNQMETSPWSPNSSLMNDQEPIPSNEIGITNKKLEEPVVTQGTLFTVVSTTQITSGDPMLAAATVMQTSTGYSPDIDIRIIPLSPQMDESVDTTINNNELHTTLETSTIQLHTSTTRVDGETILPSDSSYITTTKNRTDVTTVGSAEESTSKAISADIRSSMPNEKYVLTKNQIESTTPVVPTTTTDMDVMTKSLDIDTETILSTKTTSNGDDTTEPTTFKSNTIIFSDDQTTSFTKSELNDIDDMTTVLSEDLAISTTTNEVSSTIANLSNTTENEIIKGAESNRHYQIVPLELKKSARYMQESKDNLPTFNVEFVVSKEDLRTDCNGTKKRIAIKPDRILTEYPKNSGVSITLREAKKRRRRHYQGYNDNGYQRFNRYKTYGYSSGWMDRASDPFESNLFNTGYRRIPFFTYTAVLPFGFIYELKSQVIEIPLDDPKYTLMILMPNHSNGLSELLLLLPTLSLRKIHNSLKPTAVHATIPTFKYTAKVDLTSALQQIGIHDVFYRYRADLSFMSPDARLYVSSIQQVVSVTAKKYNTPPVYEIQRKYVEQDFVVSRPFVYFVLDIHTKVSLIAGVITDPLAAPIWV